jgi:hypothetical protein
MICIDVKYSTSLYWIQRVDMVVCFLDTVKTAFNSNICIYWICIIYYKQSLSDTYQTLYHVSDTKTLHPRQKVLYGILKVSIGYSN